MKDFKKKVMILNNFTSPYISEAIIVLKDYDPRFDTRAIEDAERIVSEYLDKKIGCKKNQSHSNKKLIKYSVGFIVMCACFITGYFFK